MVSVPAHGGPDKRIILLYHENSKKKGKVFDF